MKAIKDNPELSYLQEHVSQVLVRKPSECAPPETDEFGKQTFSNTVSEGNKHRKVNLLPYFSVGLKSSSSKLLLRRG